MKTSRIALFGAGNLAINLAKALSLKGYRITQVYSKTMESASWLANRLNAAAITSPSDFDHTADVIIFALNDSVLPQIIAELEFTGQLALHTSGTVPLDIFKGKAEHYGVLYPLQTFSKSRTIKFHEVPLFIEAGSSKDLANLKMLAESLATKVYIVDSAQRRQLHVAGVFANNFVNHFYSLANEMVKKSGFMYDVLKPIILETALKAIEADNPSIVQTGPAVRFNKDIVEKHIEMLASKPDLQNLYTFATNSIATLHHQKTII